MNKNNTEYYFFFTTAFAKFSGRVQGRPVPVFSRGRPLIQAPDLPKWQLRQDVQAGASPRSRAPRVAFHPSAATLSRCPRFVDVTNAWRGEYRKQRRIPERVPVSRRLVSSPIVEHALDLRRQRHAVRI